MDLTKLQNKLDTLPEYKRTELLELLKSLEDAKTRERVKNSFLPFVKEMWSSFIEGHHHSIMAEAFERVA